MAPRVRAYDIASHCTHNTVYVSSAGIHQRSWKYFRNTVSFLLAMAKAEKMAWCLHPLRLLKKDPLAKLPPPLLLLPGPIPRGGMKEGRGRDERAFKLTVTY